MTSERQKTTDASPSPSWRPEEIRAATALASDEDVAQHALATSEGAIGDDEPSEVVAVDASTGHTTRREVVREGAKLAFVAPLLSTFLASQAYAANYSCYPAGEQCGTGSEKESCCNGACPSSAPPNVAPFDCNGDGDVFDPGEGIGEECLQCP